jgi:hypothetical protein
MPAFARMTAQRASASQKPLKSRIAIEKKPLKFIPHAPITSHEAAGIP